MTGFVALHRDAFQHPLLRDAERFRAWFWLVANAAWKPTKHNARGHIIEVERGQICAGREYLAKEWGWSPSAVERFLARLETEQMIERSSGQMKTVITICNYGKYQAMPDQTEQISEQTFGQKPDRNRTDKEQGNKETREPIGSHTPLLSPQSDLKAGMGAVRKHTMPADWIPGPLPREVQDLVDTWPPGRLERETASFRNYWLDDGRKRPGWDRTFHNWIRRLHDQALKEQPRAKQFAPRPEQRSTSEIALDLALAEHARSHAHRAGSSLFEPGPARLNVG